MLYVLTPGITDDMAKLINHPFYKGQETEEILGTEYSTYMIDRMIEGARYIINIPKNLQVQYNSLVMRMWLSDTGDVTMYPVDKTIHMNDGSRTSDIGRWMYIFGSVSPINTLIVSKPFYTSKIEVHDNELMYFDPGNMKFLSSTEIANSTDIETLHFMLPGAVDMFSAQSAMYNIPKSLLK